MKGRKGEEGRWRQRERDGEGNLVVISGTHYKEWVLRRLVHNLMHASVVGVYVCVLGVGWCVHVCVMVRACACACVCSKCV